MEDPGHGFRAPQGSRRAGRGRAAAGIACILASASCYGCMAIFGRFALRSGADLPTLLALRFTLAALGMWGVFAWRRQTLPRGRYLAALLAMGAIGYAGQAFCYFEAITLASVGLVALLLYLFPAMVAVLNWLVLGHPLSRPQVAAVAVALAGSALTIGRAGAGSLLGVLLSLLAAVIVALYILAGSLLPATVTPTATATVIISSAAMVCAGVAAARGLHPPGTAAGWAALLGVAVVCTVLPILLFFEGLERVGPVRASVYSTVEPLVTLGLGAALLGEPITVTRLLGGGLIVAAVILLAREELRQAATPPGVRPPAPAVPPPTPAA